MKLKQLLILGALAFSSLSFAADSELITVQVQGEGATKLEAVSNAWTAAVQKAVGIALYSTEEVQQTNLDENFTQQVATYSKGQIDSYQIVKADKQPDGSWVVEINAKVEKGIIEDTFGKAVQKSEVQYAKSDLQNLIANVTTKIEKAESAVDVLKANAHLLDFSDTVKYQSTLDDPKKPFYQGVYQRKDQETIILHHLSIDEDKYYRKARELEKVIEKIAMEKYIDDLVPYNPIQLGRIAPTGSVFELKYSYRFNGFSERVTEYVPPRRGVGLIVKNKTIEFAHNRKEWRDGFFSACFPRGRNQRRLTCYLLPPELMEYFDKTYEIYVDVRAGGYPERYCSLINMRFAAVQSQREFRFIPVFSSGNISLPNPREGGHGLLSHITVYMKFNNKTDLDTLKRIEGGTFEIEPQLPGSYY